MKSLIRNSLRYFSDSKLKIVKVTSADVKNFQKDFSPQELEKYLDPYGFLNPEEKEHYEKEQQNESQANQASKQEKGKEMPKEFGMKPRGKEPTRYGDWERNGKCVDF